MSALSRRRHFAFIATALLAGLSWACAAGQGASEPLAPCFVDGDCSGDLVCSGGVCVPEGTAAGDTEDDDGGLSAGSDSSEDTDGGSESGADSSEPGDSGNPDPTGSSEPLDTDGGETDDGVCIEQEQPCEVSSDCCGHEEEGAVGTSVCIVDPEDNVSCTSWCETHDDCASTCCAGVADSELGACIPGSICRAFDRCLDGVVLFCQCGVLAESECTDEEIDAYVTECSALQGGTYDIFDCLGGHYTGTTDPDELLGICVDGLDECNPT